MGVISIYRKEKELIDLAVKNNRQAQKEIFNSYAPKMLGVCRQYIRDIHQAEDSMLIGFTKVFSGIEKFEHKGSFEGWIRRIMVNECISYIRAQKKWLFIEDENYFEETVNPIENQLSVDDIQFLIDHLPDGCKMVFNLYVIEGYKHHEISTMLGINQGTSKSQLANARKILQKAIIKLKNHQNGTE